MASRYSGIKPVNGTDADGRECLWLPFPTVQEPTGARSYLVVREGDRMDLLAERVLGAPTLWNQIYDANPWLDPFEVTAVPGRLLVIPKAGR